MTNGGYSTACNAPFTSLHLDPRGNVRACCMNEYQSLGRIGEMGLREIWQGPRVAELRSRLASGDFGLGCGECGLAVASGVEGAAYLHVFDHLGPVDPMPPWPAQLELALTNTCNLQCVMCNGELSSAIRARREGRPPLPPVYDDEFFEELADFLPHLESVVLLGGEPFLGRESMKVLEMMLNMGTTPRLHVTTNGTVLNERVMRVIDSFPVHVAVSMDALSPDLASDIRVGVDHETVLQNVESIAAATRRPGKGCSISFTLMRQNWQELAPVLEWAERRDMDVFVNRVSSPPAFSLRHAPVSELDAVVSGFSTQDAHLRKVLSRNLAVWEREVTMLEELRHRCGPTETTIGLGNAGSGNTVSGLDRVLAEFGDDWADGLVQADEHQIVRIADGDADETGIHFDALVGHPLQDLVARLQDDLGRTTTSELSLNDGVEQRRLVFERDHVRTEVRAFLHPGLPQRWTLRVARTSETTVPGETGSHRGALSPGVEQ